MGMKNKGRHFTVIVIPHTEDSVLNVRIPLFLLQLAGVLVVFILLSAFIVFQSYQDLQHGVNAAEHLRQENRILSEQLDLLTGFTEELLLQVEQVGYLEDEVRRLVNLPPIAHEQADSSQLLSLNYEDSRLRTIAGRGGNEVVDRTVLNISSLQELLPRQAEEMEQLKEDILEHNRELAATPSIWPARGKVTSEFGPRRSPFTGRREFHDGIDIAAPRGTPIHAAADGKVVLSTYQRGIGNVIIIDHGYDYQTLYGHLSGFAVRADEEVIKGQLIGYMGNTGMSTGPHLHYSVFVNGVAVDPRDYLS